LDAEAERPVGPDPLPARREEADLGDLPEDLPLGVVLAALGVEPLVELEEEDALPGPGRAHGEADRGGRLPLPAARGDVEEPAHVAPPSPFTSRKISSGRNLRPPRAIPGQVAASSFQAFLVRITSGQKG